MQGIIKLVLHRGGDGPALGIHDPLLQKFSNYRRTDSRLMHFFEQRFRITWLRNQQAAAGNQPIGVQAKMRAYFPCDGMNGDALYF